MAIITPTPRAGTWVIGPASGVAPDTPPRAGSWLVGDGNPPAVRAGSWVVMTHTPPAPPVTAVGWVRGHAWG